MPSSRLVEVNFKREITRIYKSMFGHGPDKTTIHIIDNVICCKMEGALSVLELNLIKTEEGIELAKRIREQIILHKRPENISTFESLMEDQVEAIDYILHFERQTIYLFIVMKNNIENQN